MRGRPVGRRGTRFNTRPRRVAPAVRSALAPTDSSSTRVDRNRVTSKAPSVTCASTAGSVDSSKGGVSRMTIAPVRTRSRISSAIRADPTTSLGFGGSGPEVSTRSGRLPRQERRASSKLTSPTRTEERPISGGSPSRSAMPGFRRSASIRTTLLPPWARAMARLVAVAVLPSPVTELVTTSDRAG